MSSWTEVGAATEGPRDSLSTQPLCNRFSAGDAQDHVEIQSCSASAQMTCPQLDVKSPDRAEARRLSQTYHSMRNPE